VKRTRAIFRQLFSGIAAHAPGLRCRLSRGDPADFPKPRNFAMCGLVADDEANIIVAPKIEDESDAVIHALLRHELAHGILLYHGHEDHSERDADELAEAVWGDRIHYDHRDVQTLAHGKWPRPGHLHR
jgi:hypothetical protein